MSNKVTASQITGIWVRVLEIGTERPRNGIGIRIGRRHKTTKKVGRINWRSNTQLIRNTISKIPQKRKYSVITRAGKQKINLIKLTPYAIYINANSGEIGVNAIEY